MYRVSRVLNNNGVIAIDMDDNQEYVLLGKGLGFGKKIAERFEKPEGASVYRLTEDTERGSARELARNVDPEFIEIADAVMQEAEARFGSVDRRVMLPLADHLSFAAARVRSGEQISNPLTDDIRSLFHSEFKAASLIKELFRSRLGLELDDHEVGYVALHVHSAIEDEQISMAMQTARAVRECIQMLEQETGEHIDILSLSYNRLMNHIKYMVARGITGEDLKVNMNDYMYVKFPKAYALASTVCVHLSASTGLRFDEMEIGYLAMHIERVYSTCSP